jgi:hypothetical protein
MKYSEGEGEEDVLGLIFWDYLHRKESLGITERNDGFMEAEDPQIWISKYNEWLDVEKKAMEYVKGKRVLWHYLTLGLGGVEWDNSEESSTIL